MRIILSNPVAKRVAQREIENAPHGFICTLSEPPRNLNQNAALHATIADIASQKQWAGEHMDVEAWKRLLTAAWCRATQQGAKIVPALDGYGFDVIYRRTSSLSKRECGELLEYVTAWAVENGVRLSAPDRMTS
jgi:hypothetical protein